MSGYIAYIDESGCDGFNEKSSEFLVIGAIVMRASRFGDLELARQRAIQKVQQYDSTRSKDWKFQTFKKLKSTAAQRWLIASEFSKVRCNAIAIVVHKKHLTKESWKQNPDELYFQASKFLVERISWACRDADKTFPEQDKSCEIIFSQRGAMRYGDFQTYIDKLRADPKQKSKADWRFIDTNLVRAEPHYDSSLGHMIVDHFVSAIGCALEYKIYGTFDDRYARIWAPKLYRPTNKAISNGIKFWPDDGLQLLKSEDRGRWLKSL